MVPRSQRTPTVGAVYPKIDSSQCGYDRENLGVPRVCSLVSTDGHLDVPSCTCKCLMLNLRAILQTLIC